MRLRYLAGAGAGLIAFALAGAARAGEVPLYQAAPAWIIATPLPTGLTTGAGAPAPHVDVQERFEDGRVWGYFDLATRIATPEMLAQNALITLPWFPDKGDLIIHELAILRGAERIDVISRGQKFSVLRREEALEQRELNGILTATLAIEGLQVGDTVRLRASVTARDAALGGRVQWNYPLIALPTQTSGAALRLSWPTAQPVRWKALADGVVTHAGSAGGYATLAVDLPLPQQAEMPQDAPLRFRHPPLFEASSFLGWRDVSQALAPLYATDRAITPGGALAGEIAAITAAERDPLARAARALRSVQDKTRYLAMGMNGGNYVPQPPEKTWAARYGDCKAKTLLLLAMLRAMGIEAEPVVASVGLDDLVPERLPSAAAFNHIFVRARIGGETVWLDGTGSGTRLADMHDTPPVHHILPLRAAGADLETVAWHAPARAVHDLTLLIDESASVDLPSVIDATLVLRGARAGMIALAASQLGAKEKRDMLAEVLQPSLGEGQFGTLTLATSPEDASVTITGRGAFTTPWRAEDRRPKRALSHMGKWLDFAPNRARPGWAALPVITGLPERTHVHTTLRLPDRGRGIGLEGDPAVRGTVAGAEVASTAVLADGTLTLDETLATSGAEIAAAAIPAERDQIARLLARAPKLAAPVEATRAWNIVNAADPPGASQIAALDAIYANAIASAEPTDTSALESRASFRNGIGDFKGAIADRTRVIAIAPSAEHYAERGDLALKLGDFAAAAADGEAARKIDPAALGPIALVARAAAERGELARAVALLDERIALGGEHRFLLQREKVSLIGEFGDPHAALGELDALIATKPGNPTLLNARCWIKATRQVAIDSALKDCTAAIELAENTAPILDSRALVWLRLGRLDEALRDLDAALLQAPALGASRFVRAIVLARLGRGVEAARDLALARRIAPRVDAEYARYGLKP